MKIAIVDDQGIFRDSLARSLADVGVDIALSVASGDELFAGLAAADLDVAIIDVQMPPSYTNEGLLAAREIKRRKPGMGVLLLSVDTATPRAIDLLREFPAGIGYLRKDEVADVEELYAFLVRLVAGEQVVGGSVVRRLLASPAQDQALSRLSPQEREVLRRMAEGLSNIGIARQLHLAERTVEDHVGRIFTKLGIGSQSTDTDGRNKRVLAVLTWLRLGRDKPDTR